MFYLWKVNLSLENFFVFYWFVTCLLAFISKSVLGTYGGFCGSGSHIVQSTFWIHRTRFMKNLIYWKHRPSNTAVIGQTVEVMCLGSRIQVIWPPTLGCTMCRTIWPGNRMYVFPIIRIYPSDLWLKININGQSLSYKDNIMPRDYKMLF